MLGKDTNPQLQKVEQAVMEKVPADLQSAFQRIVAAGEKVMYSQQTRHMLANQVKQGGEMTELIGEGVAKLFAILYKQSKGTMPMKAAIPAAQVLVCEALDFMEKAGQIEVSNDVIAETTKAMIAYLLQLMGFSKDKIDQYTHAGMAANGGVPDDGSAPDDVQAAQAGAPAAGAGLIAGARGAA
jgi:hypothetical protein